MGNYGNHLNQKLFHQGIAVAAFCASSFCELMNQVIIIINYNYYNNNTFPEITGFLFWCCLALSGPCCFSASALRNSFLSVGRKVLKITCNPSIISFQIGWYVTPSPKISVWVRSALSTASLNFEGHPLWVQIKTLHQKDFVFDISGMTSVYLCWHADSRNAIDLIVSFM